MIVRSRYGTSAQAHYSYSGIAATTWLTMRFWQKQHRGKKVACAGTGIHEDLSAVPIRARLKDRVSVRMRRSQ